VVTGYALILTGPADGAPQQHGAVHSRVTMRAISTDEARSYADTGEPLDKAGGYALQGEAARFVERVDGSRDNVIGLPLAEIAPLLARVGVKPGG
jgi:septum formation protein